MAPIDPNNPSISSPSSTSCLPDFSQINLSGFFSQLKKLCDKIWQAVCTFFSKISSLFQPAHDFFFSAREITLLRDHRLPRFAPPEGNIAAPPLKEKDVSVIAPEGTKKSQDSPPPYKIFDEPLEGFRELIRDFSAISVDLLHEKYLASTVKSIQDTAPTFPPMIKSIAKLLIEMGDRASKPLFKRFSQQKKQVIDPALRKIFKTLLKDHGPQEKMQETLSAPLKKKLQEDLKTVQLQKGQLLDKHYIDPLLNWLIHSDHSTPLNELFQPEENFKEDLIDKIMEQALVFLVERKIDYYATQLQNILKDQLDSIVLKTMHINAERLSNYFTERFSDLVSNMPFTQSFDAVVKDVVGEQVKGYIQAEMDPKLRMEKEILEKSKLALGMQPKNLKRRKTSSALRTTWKPLLSREEKRRIWNSASWKPLPINLSAPLKSNRSSSKKAR